MANWYELMEPFFTPTGMTPPDWLLLISILCGLLFGMADYRIGLMSTLMILISVLSFFIFYGFDTMRALLLIFSCIVIMAISLYTEKSGGGYLS